MIGASNHQNTERTSIPKPIILLSFSNGYRYVLIQIWASVSAGDWCGYGRRRRKRKTMALSAPWKKILEHISRYQFSETLNDHRILE